MRCCCGSKKKVSSSLPSTSDESLSSQSNDIVIPPQPSPREHHPPGHQIHQTRHPLNEVPQNAEVKLGAAYRQLQTDRHHRSQMNLMMLLFCPMIYSREGVSLDVFDDRVGDGWGGITISLDCDDGDSSEVDGKLELSFFLLPLLW